MLGRFRKGGGFLAVGWVAVGWDANHLAAAHWAWNLVLP